MELAQLFWSKVQMGGLEECWPWSGCRTSSGHGQFGTGANYGLSRLAHRTSFILVRGWPTGIVCHRCNNPLCVNPLHLYDGTPQSNMEDKVAAGRQSRFPGESHPQSKLTQEQALHILTSKLSVSELISLYPISPQTIS